VTTAPRPTAALSRPVGSVLVTIAIIAALQTIGGVAGGDRLPEPVGHALSHLFVGAPLGVLLVVVLRRWPPPRRTAPGRLARRLVTVALVGVVAGQLLEVVGARVDEPTATTLEGVAHTAGMIVTTLSMLILAGGGILALVAATRERAVPRWAAAILIVLALGAITVMVVGAPGS
jgi:hypothetical protein